MSKRYRIKVDTWPAGEHFTHSAKVYDTSGVCANVELGTDADEALAKARRWVKAQSEPVTTVHEVWVDERGRDAAAPEARDTSAG